MTENKHAKRNYMCSALFRDTYQRKNASVFLCGNQYHKPKGFIILLLIGGLILTYLYVSRKVFKKFDVKGILHNITAGVRSTSWKRGHKSKKRKRWEAPKDD
jgi:hypothetical protein